MEEAKDPVTFAPCQQCRMSVYCRECLAEFIKREEKAEAVRLQCPLCRRPVKKTRNFKPYGDAEAVRRLKAETGVSEKETIDARKRARAAELCTENGQVGRAWREAGEKRLEKRRREDNEEESERVAQALRQEEAARQQQVAEEEERQNEELLKRLLAEEAKADKDFYDYRFITDKDPDDVGSEYHKHPDFSALLHDLPFLPRHLMTHTNFKLTFCFCWRMARNNNAMSVSGQSL